METVGFTFGQSSRPLRAPVGILPQENIFADERFHKIAYILIARPHYVRYSSLKLTQNKL